MKCRSLRLIGLRPLGDWQRLLCGAWLGPLRRGGWAGLCGACSAALFVGAVRRRQCWVGGEAPQCWPQPADVCASIGCAAALALVQPALERGTPPAPPVLTLSACWRTLLAPAEHYKTQPLLPLLHACGQHPRVGLAAACAAPAVEAIFIDLRAHRRNLEELAALQLIRRFNLGVALAAGLGLAIHHAVHLGVCRAWGRACAGASFGASLGVGEAWDCPSQRADNDGWHRKSPWPLGLKLERGSLKSLHLSDPD